MELSIKLVIQRSLYYDARSEKHKKSQILFISKIQCHGRDTKKANPKFKLDVLKVHPITGHEGPEVE
jgi:hypothetical protein